MIRDATASTLLKNTAVALLVALIYALTLWPLQLREQLEASPDYPKNVEIFFAESFAMAAVTDSQSLATAKQTLNTLLADGTLAVESSLLMAAQRIPKLFVSKSMFDLGLIRLTQGEARDEAGYFVAQTGGPYAVGDSTDEGVVSGTADITWSQIFMTDAVVLQLIQNDLDKVPGLVKSGAKFYLQSQSEDEKRAVLELVQTYTGTQYTHLPLYEFLLRDNYTLELRQARLQKLAAVFLLACLLLTLYADLSRAWFQQREIYRIERILGRSRGYFFRKWFVHSLNQWLWGLLISTLTFAGFSFVEGSAAGLGVLLPWFLGIAAVGTLMAVAMASLSSRFPLARASLDTERTWRDNLAPVFITFCLVFGITFLFADTFTQWYESSQSIRSLGADRLTALTTAAAKEVLPEDLCHFAEARACAAFGLANIHLWPPELIFLEDEEGLSTLFQFSPQDAGALRISLVEGRWPAEGAREAVVNERALERVRAFAPDFGVGTGLNLGYEVVGVIRTPAAAKYAIFDSLYRSPVLVASGAPDLLPEYFLSPLGESGLVLTLNKQTDIAALKTKLRSRYRDLEFIQPAAYAQTFAKTLRNSLVRLLLIFLAASALAILAYQNLISASLAKRTLELSVWRLLGMTVKTLRTRMSRSVLAIPLVTGVVAAAVGCFFLLSTNRNEVVPYAFVCGILMSLFLALTCTVLLHLKVRPMLHQEISETYRKAL